MLPPDTHVQYHTSKQDSEDDTLPTETRKRHIIIRETAINSEEELARVAKNFLLAINQYSQAEYVTDLNEIENWIQQDFISLDESLLGHDLKTTTN